MTVYYWQTDIRVNSYRMVDSEDNWESREKKSRNQLLLTAFSFEINYSLGLSLLLLGSYNLSGVNPNVSLVGGFILFYFIF